jgi:hypothetical protein
VDQMLADSLAPIHHLDVKQLSSEVALEGRAQIIEEAKRLAELPSWKALPLSRPACDVPFVCDFQAICYSSGAPEPESFGYRRLVQLVP